jgi:hypothetical protein
MRSSERVRPKYKYEALPGLPEPHTGTKIGAPGGRRASAGQGGRRGHSPVDVGSSLHQSGTQAGPDWLRLQASRVFGEDASAVR